MFDDDIGDDKGHEQRLMESERHFEILGQVSAVVGCSGSDPLLHSNARSLGEPGVNCSSIWFRSACFNLYDWRVIYLPDWISSDTDYSFHYIDLNENETNDDDSFRAPQPERSDDVIRCEGQIQSAEGDLH